MILKNILISLAELTIEIIIFCSEKLVFRIKQIQEVKFHDFNENKSKIHLKFLLI